ARPADPSRDAGVVRARGLQRGCPRLPCARDAGLLPDPVRPLRALLPLRHRRRRRRVPRTLRRRGLLRVQPHPAVTRPRPGHRRRGRREEAAGTGMTGSLVIAPRFCGPPDCGNGGYVCGLIAAYLDGQAEITLRRPPPLATPMAVDRDGQGSV